jgi:serine protease Do
MGTKNRESKLIEARGRIMRRKIFSAWALSIALLVAGAGILRAQEAPEPPEPPDPPDSEQFFLLNDGTAHLGVTLRDVSAEKAHELKLPAVAGALVSTVQKGSAAAKAGLVAGDAIIEFDGVHVRSSAELRRLIRETPNGRTVDIKVVRDGKTQVLSAKLESSSVNLSFNGPGLRLPSINVTPEIHIPPMDFSLFGDHRAMLGISAEELTPQLAQYFGVKQGKGVLVSEVTAGGAADKAGIKAGDVIVQVEGKPISGMEELRSALNDNFTDDTRKVSLTIVRDRREQTVNAELTRSQTWEKRSYNDAAQSYTRALEQLKRAQDSQQRKQEIELRGRADAQRAMVQAEVLKEQQKERAEWQRQLQQQMKSLKDQPQQMRNVRVVERQQGEI